MNLDNDDLFLGTDVFDFLKNRGLFYSYECAENYIGFNPHNIRIQLESHHIDYTDYCYIGVCSLQQLYDIIDGKYTPYSILKQFLENKATVPQSANNSLNQKTNGCYIATCVYGSYDCPEVWTLRRYRDYVLRKTVAGRLFIKCYYAISPTLVKRLGHTKMFRSVNRSILDKWVDTLRGKGYSGEPYQD